MMGASNFVGRLSKAAAFLLPIAVSSVGLAIAVKYFNLPGVEGALQKIGLWPALSIGAAMLVGAVLAGFRLSTVARDLGSEISTREALMAMASGQIVGSMTIQLLGQVAGRTAILRRNGVSLSTNVAIAFYEKLAALAVSACFALVGAISLFGHIDIDLDAGGSQLLRLLAGCFAACIGGAVFGWGRKAMAFAWPLLNRNVASAVLRCVAITVAMQVLTIVAYVAAAHSVTPETPLTSLISAAVIVAFAASIPISFSGWGVREVSAIFAFGYIGIRPESAFAISLVVGLLGIGVLFLISAVTALFPPKSTQQFVTSKSLEIGRIVTWCIGVSAATLIGFNVYLPTASGQLSVNLADIPAIFGGVMFAADYVNGRRPILRVSSLPAHVATVSVVMLISLLVGIARFGVTDWALINKGFGFIILLCYAATSALTINRFGRNGVILIYTFLGALAGLTVFDLVASLTNPLSLTGFSLNRNAFAFLLSMAICLIPFAQAKYQTFLLSVFCVGACFTGSRAGMTTVAIIILVGLWLRSWSIKSVAIAVATMISAVVIKILALNLVLGLTGLKDAFGFVVSQEGSDTQRLVSIVAGIRIFLDYPIFGAGVGRFMHDTSAAGSPLIIHSTPVWIAAEMGLIGVAVIALPIARILLTALKSRSVPNDAMLMMVLVAALFGAVHEISYQRSLWLVAGLLLTIPNSCRGRGRIPPSPDGQVVT